MEPKTPKLLKSSSDPILNLKEREEPSRLPSTIVSSMFKV